uniref:Uncharacterized protein n=1 Tax=Cucumis sativus TaxID=3659 RepID=A0A0A0L7S2_CUCSA
MAAWSVRLQNKRRRENGYRDVSKTDNREGLVCRSVGAVGNEEEERNLGGGPGSFCGRTSTAARRNSQIRDTVINYLFLFSHLMLS